MTTKSLEGLQSHYTPVTPSIKKPAATDENPEKAAKDVSKEPPLPKAERTRQPTTKNERTSGHSRAPTEKADRSAPVATENLTGELPLKPGEIPVAARIRGPGPAAYGLPPTIGGTNVHFMVKPKWKRSPMFTFGVKSPSPKAWVAPAPNAFFPACDRHGTSKGPAFSIGAGFKKDRKDGKVVVVRSAYEEIVLDVNSPGPGKYDPSIEGTSDVGAPRYSLTGRWHIHNPRPQPGPGDYSAAPTIGPKPAPNMPSPPSYTIRQNHPEKLSITSPGPAAYNTLAVAENTMKANPAYSFGSRVKYLDPFTSRREHTVLVVSPNDDTSKLPPIIRTVISHKRQGTSMSDGTSAESKGDAGQASPKSGDIGSSEKRPIIVVLPEPLLDVPAPAPNTYDVNRPSLHVAKKKAPSFSFRVRHSEFEAFVPEPRIFV
ncbi:Outer dense fiber protein 3-like protein 2 [Gonapodya sp. JEL0774]|nr:Outer dense fiber protein 3-like protein 2 [Gonapodya sp. JEL0774]